MTTLLRALGMISGIILIGAIMLMSPKGGLGFGIGGVGGSNEYGSKKSIEYTLKKVALVCSILTVLCFLFIPYTNVVNTPKIVGTGSSLLNNLQQNDVTTGTVLSGAINTGVTLTGKVTSGVAVSGN